MPAIPSRGRPATATVATLLCSALASVAFAQSPAARPATPAAAAQSYDIPASSLTQALNLFAQRAGVALSFDPQLTQGRASDGLRGTYTVTAGFQALLRSANLEAVTSGAGYTLRRAPAEAPAAAATPAPPRAAAAPAAPARPPAAYEPSLPAINVTGYRTDRVVGSTRTDETLRDTPQTVNIVNSERIRDENFLTLDEALQKIPSIGYADGRNITIRGFNSEDFLRVDGLRGRSSADNTFGVPLSNIDRVEVLKGPNAILYGSGEYGGVVNAITKKPLAQARREVGLGVGNYRYKRAEADFTGPLNEDRSLRYRLVGESTHDGLWYVNSERRDTFVAPSLQWNSGGTTVLLQAELRTAFQRPNYWGVTAVAPGGQYSKAMRKNWFGSLADGDRNKGRVLGGDVTHAFDNGIELTARVRSARTEVNYRSLFGFGLDADGRTLQREIYASYGKNYTNSGSAYAVIPWRTAGWGEHKVLVGLDASKTGAKPGYGYCFSAAECGIVVPPVDIYAPDYRLGSGALTYVTSGTAYYGRQTRWYVQDTAKFGDRWVVVAGAAGNRFDQLDSGSTLKGSKVTPRLGVVYKSTAQQAVSLSYSSSFIPPQLFNVQLGAPNVPERGRQAELAWRYDSADRRLTASAAAYRIDRRNIAYTDYVGFPNNLTWTSTEQRSQGFELELTGKLLPNWSVQTGYGYVDARIVVSPSPAEVGLRLMNADRHTFSAWSKHDIGALPGLSFGWGVRYVADAAPGGDIGPRNYAVWDAALAYRASGWDVSLNVKNATDEVFAPYQASREILFNAYGPARSVQLTARKTF